MSYSSRKGNKGEDEVEALLRQHGLQAFRRGGAGREDLQVRHDYCDFGAVEVKKQAGVPKFPYEHINQNGARSLIMQRSCLHERNKPLWVWYADDLAATFAELFGTIAQLKDQLGQDAVLRRVEHIERRVTALEEDVRGKADALSRRQS